MTTSAPWQSPQASWSVLVEAPTEEPITLEEAKLRAGLAWASPAPPAVDPRDELLLGFIAAARQQVERDTGLALITQTRDLYFTLLADGYATLPMHALPLQEVLEVTPYDAAAQRALGPPRAPGRIGLATIRGVPHLTTGAFDDVTTAAVARCIVGYGDRAALRAAAPLLVQAVGLLTAHLATAGRDAVITGTIASQNPLGYEQAIESYRLVWVP